MAEHPPASAPGQFGLSATHANVWGLEIYLVVGLWRVKKSDILAPEKLGKEIWDRTLEALVNLKICKKCAGMCFPWCIKVFFGSVSIIWSTGRGKTDEDLVICGFLGTVFTGGIAVMILGFYIGYLTRYSAGRGNKCLICKIEYSSGCGGHFPAMTWHSS